MQSSRTDKSRHHKQRHTANRIFERLGDEHGLEGGITIVTDYIRARKRRTQEVFVPLEHKPGHAQVDFGDAFAVVAGVERKIHFFAMDLPHSDACVVKAFGMALESMACSCLSRQRQRKPSAMAMSRRSLSLVACRNRS